MATLDGPRRSMRKHDPTQHATSSASISSPPKRAKTVKTDGNDLDYLLTNPKSKLTTMDLTDIFHADSWMSLSTDSQNRLVKLLPSTAFTTFQPKIDPTHPSVSYQEVMDVDDPATDSSIEKLDPSFFKDIHFLAALRTFQDHLYVGWMAPSHRKDVETYTQGIRDGTLHALWKDQVWQRENAEVNEEENVTTSSPTRKLSRTGEARDVKLTDLVKHGVVRIGDILVYKRVFSLLPLTIEKDVMVTSFDSFAHSIRVLVSPGTVTHLPQPIALSPDPANHPLPDDERLLAMSITTPSSLETGILDVDGRVEKSNRPNGNAWKNISVWRRKDDCDFGASPERGGRENTGTLFYLRSCLYYDH